MSTNDANDGNNGNCYGISVRHNLVDKEETLIKLSFILTSGNKLENRKGVRLKQKKEK